MSDDFHCPECGAEVHPNAFGCRACGARKENGRWMQSSTYDGVDLPDDYFDYDEFIRGGNLAAKLAAAVLECSCSGGSLP